MNNIQYKVALDRELNQLNRQIDAKIIHGLNYKEDAKRHKKLLAQLRQARRAPSFLSRSISSLRYVSMFLF